MTVHSRVVRLLLLLAFVAGGGGIPALDAVLYHHANPADSPQGVHLEPPGSSCHTDTCLAVLAAISGVEDRRLPGVPLPDPHQPVPELGRDGIPSASVHPPGPGLPRSPPAS
jgi:hypothetical protein